MGEVEWTNDLAIRLIEEYRNKPVLWDTSHDLYRVQTMKYEAWSELAHTFDCDIADVRKKLNSIFASHRREKTKIRNGGRSNWFLYNYMKFLPSHLENDESPIMISSIKRHRENEETEQSDEEAESSYPADLHEEIDIKQEKSYDKPKKPREQLSHRPRLRPFRRRVIKEVPTSQIDSKLVEALRLLRRSDLCRKKDECDSFGEYIADSLRKHDERTQSMIKQAINNILFEQEMKKYSAAQYVVITNMDENPLTLDENMEK